MKMNFPENEMIELIHGLEAGTCPIPSSNSDRVSPREAADLRMEGIELKRNGDLVGANQKFIEMFRQQDTICSDGLWSWAKVLLLAKDFEHLQLLMHAEFANNYRGESLFSPMEWMNVHLNMPGLEIEWLYDGSKPNYRISALDYFEYPEQLVERISAYGGNNGYWRFNYSWSPDDYLEFIKYFGPLATLVIDNTAYRWTGDEPDDLLKLYESVYAEYAAFEEQPESDVFQYDVNAEYTNERGLPTLPAPDGEICDLIDMLEGNCCSLPDAGNPPRLDATTAELLNKAQDMRKVGNLRGAHANFLEIFETQRSLSSMILYSWVRVFLLAKDFGHAQLVLQLAETNLFRGQKWYCFGSKSALDRLLVPIPKGMDEFQAMRYQSENAVDYNNREAVEASIAKLGGNDSFWPQRYKLSDDEYREFKRYFGEYSGRYKVDFEYERRSY